MKHSISIAIAILALCILHRADAIATNKTTAADKKKQHLMKNLYNANNFADLTKLGVQMNEPRRMGIQGRAGVINKPAALIASDVKDATPGRCDPKPVCISNPLTGEISSNQFAFPPCINIHRCDGCCPSNEKCVAIKSHEVKLQKVGIINFDDEQQPRYNEKLVSVLNHTECQCQCQWATNEDCRRVNKYFVKSTSACECECPEEVSCDAFHEFDKASCSCKCRRDKFARLEQSCKNKPGFNWSEDHCRCEATKTSTGNKEIRISHNNI